MYSVERCDPYRQIHTLYHKFNEPQKRIFGMIGAHSTLPGLRAIVRVAAIIVIHLSQENLLKISLVYLSLIQTMLVCKFYKFYL